MVKKAKAASDPAPSFEIAKTDTGKIMVQVSEYKGKIGLDIRYYYLDKASGEFKPSPKGCSIPVDQIKSLRIRLRKLHELAISQGLCEEV